MLEYTHIRDGNRCKLTKLSNFSCNSLFFSGRWTFSWRRALPSVLRGTRGIGLTAMETMLRMQCNMIFCSSLYKRLYPFLTIATIQNMLADLSQTSTKNRTRHSGKLVSLFHGSVRALRRLIPCQSIRLYVPGALSGCIIADDQAMRMHSMTVITMEI